LEKSNLPAPSPFAVAVDQILKSPPPESVRVIRRPVVSPPAPEGEEPYKAVNANLIPTLVKAIQEQQALITQLQADVAALKGQA